MKASCLGQLCNKSPFSVKNSSYFRGLKTVLISGVKNSSYFQGLKTVLIFRGKRNECCRAVYDVGCVWGDFTGSAIEGLVKPCDVNYSKTVLVIMCHTDRITMVGASVVSQILHGTLPDVPYKAYMAYWAEYRFGARGAAPCTCQVRCRQFPRRIDFATSRKFRIFGPA